MQKKILTIVFALMVMVGGAGFYHDVSPVYAQSPDMFSDGNGGGALDTAGAASAAPGITVADVGLRLYNKIKDIFDRNYKIIGQSLFQTTLQTYLNNLAYNTATFIAQGGVGQKPLVRTKNFARVLNDSRDAAYGDFIGNLSEDFFKGSGLNLCAPSLDTQVRITLGTIADVGGQAPKPPKCELNQIKENWKQFGQSLDSGQWLAQAMVGLSTNQRTGLLGMLVDPNQNDLGIFLQVSSEADRRAQLAADVAKISEETCKGYKDKGAKISDDVLVHCAKVMGIDENAYRDALLEASLIKTEDVFLNAAKLFAKSLTAKLLNKYISGSWSLSNLYGGGTTNLRDSLINQLRNKVDLRRFGSASELFADLKTVNVEQIDEFDYLQNLTACPPDRKLAQPDNCTIDNTFLAAINNKETVGQALAQGHLRADWPLISYLNASQNGDKSCFQNGYCYGNIARLRSYRILPLGWEIAAALSPIARPVTLGEAVDCFDNGPKCILDPATNIFYHLIDPNWVLTAPSTQCKALVYGPTLEDVTSNQRQQVCVDRPSCLSQDSKGNCVGGYGYCTQERNIWRFSGESCQEQYSSCQVFTRRDNGAKYSYLQNTLESCDAGQAGCSWYSLNQENVGTAGNPDYQWNPNDRIYLNNKLTSCSQQDAGCQEFINPQTNGINLLANGNFDTYQLNIATDKSNGDYFNDTLPDSFSGWVANGTNFNSYTVAGDNSYIGTSAVKLVGDGQLSASALAGSLIGNAFTLSWYGKATTACTANAALGSQSTSAVSAAVNYTTDWQRFQLTHTFTLDNADQQLTVFLGSLAGCGALYLDGVKLELGSTPSSYNDYGNAGKVYLNGTRFSCKAEEVGCNLYSPTNGGATVPGVVTNADRCPTECVGYQTYIQLPTAFETIEQPTAGTTNVNFIASSAKQCNATDVGCSAFTNLDEVAAGGEGKHYYSFLRQCVAANFGITYYTLEGSDTSGFQVRTWQVLKSNLDGGPCTNVAPGGTSCQDTATTQATCQASDVSTNPNCREFFDTDGISKFRLQDKVIFADSNCHPLRRTSGVVYSGLDKESRTCSAAAVGCTEFRGNQGNNLRQVSSDTFESGSYQPWQTGTVTPVYSAESTNSGGHSMSWTSGVVSRSEGASIVPGREYYLSAWLKAETAGTEFKAFLGKFDGSQTKCDGSICEFTATSISPIQLTTGWQQYQLGPLHVDSVTATNDVLLQLEANPRVFVDNIILKESISNLTVVANSWKTPTSCDQPFVGANLGCQEYKGPNNSTVALRSFSQICRQEAVGCQAVVNTQNSNSPYQQVYHAGDKSQITVSADSLEYIVVDQKKSCSAAYQGCTLMGRPTFNRDLPETDPDYVRSYTPVFQINDPDRYDQQLCQNSGLFCQEYSDSKGNSAYYRDPYNRTCTYKEGVSIQGVSFTGWFQTDSLQAGQTPIGCYSNGIPPFTQDQFAIHPTADPLYGGWVGTCPASQNQCSEFVDTQATDGENLFANANFANSTAGWASWSAYGNTLNSAATFNANGGTATITTNPTGTGLFFQRLFTQDPQTNLKMQNTETYNLSADVRIDNFFADDKSGGAVQAVIRCVWDSPYDQDYCGIVGTGFDVTVDYTKPCTTSDQCGGGNNFCYKAAQGYCQSNTDKTNVACTNNSRCSSLGAGYTCETNFGYQSTDSQNNRRDHLTEYYVGADIKKRDGIQSLNVVANIGSDSQGDELVYCEPTFRVSSGYYQQSNTGCPAGANNENNPNCFNTACTNSGQSCNPVLTACSGGTCGGASKVEFSNVSLRKVKSYFYLNNDNIDDSTCNGQVSKNNGCILFDDVNDNDKIYNSYLTYLASEKVGGKPVSPVVCDANSSDQQLRDCTNDANRVIKVNRDRECSQWLACKSSSQIFDPQTKGYKQICSEVGLCDKYSSSGDLLNCANWLPETQTKLDYANYVSRDTRYEATDYSGMSMYNRYSVDNLHLLDISISAKKDGPDALKPDYRLVKFVDCVSSTGSCSDANGSGSQYGDPAYAKCGPGDIGRVFNHNGQSECAVGIDGSRFDPISPFVVKVSTRAYAEQDAPFPQSLSSGAQSSTRKVTFGFQQANICDSSVASCETGYYKMQYGGSSAVRYYSINGPLGGTEVPTCICDGGSLDGSACKTVENVNDKSNTTSIETQCPGGNPIQLRRSDVYLNWPGYCLESDTSTHINASPTQYACLSWLPVDIAPGGTDYFNQYREAGYSYKAPAYYCAEVGVKETRRKFTIDCLDSASDIEKPGTFIKVDANGQALDSNSTEDPTVHGAGLKDQRRVIDGKYFAYELGQNCGGGIFSGIDHPVAVLPISQINDGSGWRTVDNCVGNIVDVKDGFDGKRYRLTDQCEADYDRETLRIQYTDAGNHSQLLGRTFFGDSEPYAACSYLAQAVTPQGDNAAITNLFWSDYKLANGDTFKINSDPRTSGAPNYSLNQDAAPFGSAIPSSGLEPSDFPRLDLKSVGTVPRAGSPYVCANDDGICGLLGQKGSRVYVDGWVTPGKFGKVDQPFQTYGDGIINLRSIFQRVFGVYRYTLGNTCVYSVCDSKLYGGENCSNDSACVISKDENKCAAVSNCINSAWGNRSCGITCASGFIANSNGQCEATFSNELSCLSACTPYMTGSNRTVVAQKDCSVVENNRYTCAYVPPSSTTVCQASTAHMECADNGRGKDLCHDTLLGGNGWTVIECNTVSDCTSKIPTLNKATFCAPATARLCVGPAFDENASNRWFKNPQDCYDDTTNALGQKLEGYKTDNSGNQICQAPDAKCKLASQVTTYADKRCSISKISCSTDADCLNGQKCEGQPYCTFQPDTYRKLCNPDTDANCDYGSANAVASNALPLDATMPFTSAQGSQSHDSKYYADTNFGPIIAEAICASDSGQCTLGKVGNFTVNGQTNGTITEDKKSNLLANISFFAMSYKDHMPIRSIKIDWGDGSVQRNIGFYKNNWSQCDPALALTTTTISNFQPLAFNYTWGNGSTLDFAGTSQACEEGIRNYFHIYHFDQKYTAGCEAGYACFKPRVSIQDNWGWCTGNLWSAVGSGCSGSADVVYGGGGSEDVIKIKAPTN